VPGTSTFTPDARGCPSGYAGKFLISAKLFNRSQQILSNLRIGIAGLSQGNLLVGENELLQERQFFDLRAANGDPIEILPGGGLDVPFSICLENRQTFEFFVNVHAMTN
jgi:hypothetical protein